MWRRIKTMVLAVVVASAALVPLFGDPRTTPVTHPLWARMLLRSMGMNEAVKTSTQASQVFATLAWRDSLSYPADQYLRADGAVVTEEGGRMVASSAAGPAEIVFPVAVVQPGDYQLRARLSGSPASPASAELTPLEGGRAVKTFTLVPEDPEAWAFGGSAHLDPGAYGASLLLPPGCSLSRVEVAPPCLNPIEPTEGWQPRGITSAQDLAITGLKTMDMEHELPPADTPIEVAAGDFQVESPPEEVPTGAAAEDALRPRALRAGAKGLRAIASIEIPSPGVYSISGFLAPGSGQRWLVDGCRKAVVCPGGSAGWRPILTQSFSAGRHTLLVSLGDSATLDRVRVEKKKSAPEDYVATMRRLGFDPGPDGPVSRDTAISAMSFIGDKRQDQLTAMCGDNVVVDSTPLPPPLLADLPDPSAPVPPVVIEPGPIGTPILPPQEPASPITPSDG
jgi:hypothetical protein